MEKYIDYLITKSSKINYDLDNNQYKYYYIKYDLNTSFFDKYIKQIFYYSLDNHLKQSDKDDKIKDIDKNERNIEKGKYNWCFNCRDEANYLSDDLLLLFALKNARI